MKRTLLAGGAAALLTLSMACGGMEGDEAELSSHVAAVDNGNEPEPEEPGTCFPDDPIPEEPEGPEPDGPADPEGEIPDGPWGPPTCPPPPPPCDPGSNGDNGCPR